MADIQLVKDSTIAIQEINEKLDELEKMMNPEYRKKLSLDEFDHWRHAVSKMLKVNFT